MSQELKILQKHLNWAQGEKHGVVPFIFNKYKTAIQLYSDSFEYKILLLDDTNGATPQDRALSRLEEHFQEEFTIIPGSSVYYRTFSKAEDTVRHFKTGPDLGYREFSKKDVSRMQKAYNKYLASEKQKEEDYARKLKAAEDTQDTIMDF